MINKIVCNIKKINGSLITFTVRCFKCQHSAVGKFRYHTVFLIESKIETI